MMPTLFIDKLSLTLPILDNLHQAAKATLDEMLIEGDVSSVDSRSDLLKSYRYAYQLMFNDRVFCTVQIAPYKRGCRFMRLEWNPASAARVHADPTAHIMVFLARFAREQAIEIFSHARITRIDLSFDLHHIPMDSFLVFTALRRSVSGKYVQQHKKFGKHGKLNATYIGRSDSDRYLLVYDKRMQSGSTQIAQNTQRTTHQQRSNGVRRIMPAWTRFELRLHDEGSWPDLLRRDNPFAQYDVIAVSGARRTRNDHAWSFFMDSCVLRGAQAALSLIGDRGERNRYRDALRMSEPPGWWSPAQLWEQMPGLLSRGFGISGG